MMRIHLYTTALVLLAIPLVSDAAGILWNGSLADISYNYASECTMQRTAGYAKCRNINQFLTQGYVSVNYGVDVFEVDAQGAKVRSLANGESVAPGTRALFEFKPHEYEDVSWTGSGSINNTPFGAWHVGAAFPTGPICAPQNLYQTYAGGSLYSVLSMDPPAKQLSVSGAGNCVAASDGVSKICTLDTPGTVGATFSFEPTEGNFYSGFHHAAGYRRNAGTNCEIWGTSPMFIGGAAATDEGSASASSAYRVEVPAQSVPFTLNVGPAGDMPTPPTTTRTSSNSGNACVVGTTLSLTMTSSDPGGKQIRYGVDWDANGSIDQYVPASGYVNSGTSQTAKRTFSTPGAKTVKALAQNEDGALSAWTTVQFTCNNAQAVTLDDVNDNAFISPEGSGPIFLQDPDLSIRALPSLVRSNEFTKIHWSATNVAEGSCRVAGNGNYWTGEASRPGGEQSNAITQRTTFTLTCTDLQGNERAASVVVNILPAFREN